MKKQLLTNDEIMRIAREDFSDFTGYTGEGDDFVDFGGANRNFMNAVERMFTITISNAQSSNGAEPFYLIPGDKYVPNQIFNITQDNSTKDITIVRPEGIPRTGTFPSLRNKLSLTGSSNPKSIESFYSFLQFSPIHVKAMKIQSSSSANQLSEFLTIRSMSPFRDMATEIINPDIYLSQDSYQDKKVIFPVDLILSKDTQIEYKVLDGNSVTITFFVDAIANSTVTLANKVTKARETFLNNTTLQSVGLSNSISNVDRRLNSIAGLEVQGLTIAPDAPIAVTRNPLLGLKK